MTRRLPVVAVAAVVILSTVIPFVAVAGVVGTASAAETWIDVDSCQTIDDPGNYQLSQNISATGNCIDIQTGNVHFDGNGYYIDGTFSGSAIDASGHGDSVTVTDVRIREYTVGIEFNDVDNGEISGVTIEPDFYSNPSVKSSGIVLDEGSRYNVVHNNSIDRPGDTLASGIGIRLQNAHNNEIRDNYVSGPRRSGIQLETARDNTLAGNYISSSGEPTMRMYEGIWVRSGANGTTLTGNTVSGGSWDGGIVTYDGIVVEADDVTLVGNDVSSVSYSGFDVSGDDLALRNNEASGNDEHGFKISHGTDVELEGNRASTNGGSGFHLSDLSLVTSDNDTASGNSGWAMTLDSASANVDYLHLSGGGPGVSFDDSTGSIEAASWATPPAGMDHIQRFVNATGLSSLDVHYTDGQVTAVDESALTTWRYSGGAWSEVGGSVDTNANTVSSSGGTGVFAPLAPDTQAPTIDDFEAYSPADGELTVTIDASEPLVDVEVTVEHESGSTQTLSTSDFQGTTSLSATISTQPGEYDVTLVRATDDAGNDGASGQTATATVGAGLSITAEAIDDGADGHVIDDETVTLRADVTGYDIQSVTADASTIGVGAVTLQDLNDDGIYELDVTVDVAGGTRGVHSITFEATDGIGQVATASDSLDLDDRAPFLYGSNVSIRGGSGSTAGDGDVVDVSLHVTDRNGVGIVEVDATNFGGGIVSLTDDNGDDWYDGSFTVDAANSVGDGYHWLTFAGTDDPGNVRDGNLTRLWLDTSDNQSPTVTSAVATNLDDADDHVGDGDRIALSVTAADDVGVDSVVADASAFGAASVALTDGDDDGVYDAQFTVDVAYAAIDGHYGIDVTAWDAAGNTETATTNALTLNTSRDLTPPIVSNYTVADPLDDGVVTDGDRVTLAVTATDEDGNVSSVTADASHFGAGTIALTDVDDDGVYEGSFTVDAALAAPDGIYPLSLTATDEAGNEKSPFARGIEIDRSVANDTEAPTIHEFDAYAGYHRNVDVDLNASERLSVIDVTVRDADGNVVATLNESAFHRSIVVQSGGVSAATFDDGELPDGSGEEVDPTPWDGTNYYGTVTVPRDGVYEITLETALDRAGNDGGVGQNVTAVVGTPTPGEGITVEGRLHEADGSPAANDTVVAFAPGTLEATAFAETDAEGNFTLSLFDGMSYHVLYAQANATGVPGPLDGSPDIAFLGTVVDNTTIDRTLPAAHSLTVTAIRNDTGAAVANATVDFSLETRALIGLVRGETNQQGRLAFEGIGRDAIEVNGTVHLDVSHSSGTYSVNQTSVNVSAPTDFTVVLNATTAPADGSGPSDGDSEAGDDEAAGGGGSDDSSSDRGSGAGGSSGASPATPTAPTVDVTTSGSGQTNVSVEGANDGSAVSVDVGGQRSGNVSLDGMDVTPLVDGDFTLNVSVSEGPPAGAPVDGPAGQPPIGYLNVSHSITDADIDEVTFRLRVSKASLAARGLAPADVVVYRYHDGQWQAASMTVVDETAEEYVLAATVPGLSVFAVGTTPAAAVEEPTQTPAATPAAETAGTPPPADGSTDASVTPTADGGPAPPRGPPTPVAALVAFVVVLGLAGTLLLRRR